MRRVGSSPRAAAPLAAASLAAASLAAAALSLLVGCSGSSPTTARMPGTGTGPGAASTATGQAPTGSTGSRAPGARYPSDGGATDRPPPMDPGTGGLGTPSAPPRVDPLSGLSLFVQPDSEAATQVSQWRAQGRQDDAGELTKISRRPVAIWLTGDGAASTVARVRSRAQAAGQAPVFVVYDIPGRDCGGYSGGGASSASAYRDWIGSIARALGSSPAVVVLEPDALAQTVAGCLDPTSTWSLLSSAVDRLKAQPGTRVYIDAGNPRWIGNPTQIATALTAAGVARADGFSVNVANFATTGDSIRFGVQLADLLDGAHFVIDTSRNGRGPLPDGSGYRGPSWCNPPGRGLGPAPTTATGQPLVDAYLWVKPPGESDGDCGTGAPRAGTWMPDYALGLARRSA